MRKIISLGDIKSFIEKNLESKNKKSKALKTLKSA